MTIKSSATPNPPLSFQEIEAEFGAQSPRSLGSYRHTQTVNGLTFDGIDSGVPSSGQIAFSDFYGKSLNIVVDCFSGSDESRINAKSNKWDNNDIVIINPSTVSKKEEGTRITIRVNKKFGSDKSDTTHCALRTGEWINPAQIIVDLGSNAKILGAGGDGGAGSMGTKTGAKGQPGGDGTSGLGIEHQGTVVNYRSGSLISAGFGGGGGGGGGRETSKNDRRAGGGGGGGGAGFPFGNGGIGGTPQEGTRQANEDVGSPGTNATENTAGTGGAGGDNDDQAFGQKGGDGGDNEQNPAAGPSDDSPGGAAGANGAAIRVTSGVSFTFGTGDLDDGEIRPSSFATPGNAATDVA